MKSILNRVKLLFLAGLAVAAAKIELVADTVNSGLARLFPANVHGPFGPAKWQGGFILVGGRAIQGYAPGTVIELSASTEAALIAAGQASASAGPPTPGAVSTTATSGCCAIAAGSSSVTITNPLISPQSLVWAVVAQAAADGTLLRVERVVCAAGSVTIYGTANATATVSIDWAILNPGGSFTSPQ